MDNIIQYAQIAALVVAAIFAFNLIVAIIKLRRVVETDKVHIVQSNKKTISYGAQSGNGNVYYEWPQWLPLIGVLKVVLPVSNFTLFIKSFEAYDLGRVPFVVDLQAAFRIEDTNLAASRVSSFDHLVAQLEASVRGGARTMFASNDIEEILQGRASFGEQFTKELEDSLKEWGVVSFRNIEIMDIRDGNGSEVIENIQAKKQSLIETQSRIEVANNKRDAEVAEVKAIREADLQKTEAEQTVQLRINEKNQAVGVAQQQAQQAVHEQARVTKEKEMAVVAVHDVQRAEITKSMEIVKAEQEKQKTVLAAEANLESEKRNAEAIRAVGQAQADAEKAKQLAPVEAQIVLAKEIGENKEYQQYLITLEKIKAGQIVGVAQAEALSNAEVKLIANGGNAPEAVNSISSIFTPAGGLNIGAAMEALSNTDAGKALIDKFTTPKS